MSQIKEQLESINESIEEVSAFLKGDYVGKTRSLIVNVEDISKFQSEVFEHDNRRNGVIDTLLAWRKDCTDLVEKANFDIEEIVYVEDYLKYEEYQNKIEKLNEYRFFQSVLNHVLWEIGRLHLVLGKGEISQEQSFSVFNRYKSQAERLTLQTAQWHDKHIESLQIDLSKERKSRLGIVGIVTKNTIGRINDGFNYTKVDAGLVQTIKSQTGENEDGDIEGNNIYSEDLHLIVDNGELKMVIKVSDSDNLSPS